METTEEIINSLRANLADYMGTRPSLSIRSIAKASGCNRYFLSKLTSGPGALKTYDFHQILLLLKFLNEKDNLRATLDSANSPVRDALMAVFKADCSATSSEKTIHKIPSELFYDFDNFTIISLASHSDMKTSIFDKCFPGNKLYKLDALIEKNIIEVKDGIIRLVGVGQILNCPLNIVEMHLPEVIKRYFLSENYGKSRCAIGFYYQNLNRTGWKKLHAIHANFMTQVADLLDDKNYYGDIPVYSINTMNTYMRVDDSDESIKE